MEFKTIELQTDTFQIDMEGVFFIYIEGLKRILSSLLKSGLKTIVYPDSV